MEQWVERYRPKILNDLVMSKELAELAQFWKKEGAIQHLLLEGPPGTGKTTFARVIVNELGLEHKEMNASDERGIDTVRDVIKSYARMKSFGKLKIVLLDEADNLCLTKDTEVLTEDGSKKIGRLGDCVNVCSVNEETLAVEKDIAKLVDSGNAFVYEVTLENGERISCTDEHPFFMLDKNRKLIRKKLKELKEGDEIVMFDV